MKPWFLAFDVKAKSLAIYAGRDHLLLGELAMLPQGDQIRNVFGIVFRDV